MPFLSEASKGTTAASPSNKARMAAGPMILTKRLMSSGFTRTVSMVSTPLLDEW